MLVAKEWIEKVLDVKRWSERIMVLRVVVGRSVVNLVSVYGRGKEEKEEFFTVGKIVEESLLPFKAKLSSQVTSTTTSTTRMTATDTTCSRFWIPSTWYRTSQAQHTRAATRSTSSSPAVIHHQRATAWTHQSTRTTVWFSARSLQ